MLEKLLISGANCARLRDVGQHGYFGYLYILCLIGQGIFCLLLIVVLHWLYCNEVKSKHNLTKERNGCVMRE